MTVDRAVLDRVTRQGAQAGLDYEATMGTLTFGASETTKTVLVPIFNDTLVEGTETFLFNLSNPQGGATLGSPTQATVSIVDNDQGGAIQFSAATYTTTEPVAASITVTRTGTSLASGASVQFATSNGTATAGIDYTATVTTLVFAAGETTKTVPIPILAGGASGDETVNLTLSNPAGGATLGARTAAVLTIVDDAPTVAFSTDTFTVSESAATAVITVRRGGVATGAVAVDYSTTDGTAQSGVDYTATAGTLSFASGVTSKTFTVPILNDSRVTAARTVILTLGNPTGSITIVTPSTATLTITDDDVAGIIEFGAPVFDIAENAGSAIITVARRSGTAGGGDRGNYTTSDGTATAGSDYTFSGGTLTFGVGETSKTFAVPILQDSLAEGVETVNLALSSPGGGATLGARTSALLRIIDDEKALGFSAQSYTVNEGGGTATITVELTGVSSTDTVTVNYATSNGTATAGLDYTTTTGTLIFPPGGTATGIRTKTFTVPILQDTPGRGHRDDQPHPQRADTGGRRPAGDRALDGHPQHRGRRRGGRDRVRRAHVLRARERGQRGDPRQAHRHRWQGAGERRHGGLRDVRRHGHRRAGLRVHRRAG